MQLFKKIKLKNYIIFIIFANIEKETILKTKQKKRNKTKNKKNNNKNLNQYFEFGEWEDFEGVFGEFKWQRL